MHPHLQIHLELARQRQEGLFGAPEASRAAAITRSGDVGTLYSLSRLVTLLRALRPAPTRIDRPCGNASHS